ncbi:T9SS type A sorting domain-containing protein [Pontibacter kalidii]|uniref:T9SS type A sorting domain-containing protein n=1 Tax=Pontibacter kalidii TaxID=2592049 RepID=UPI002251F892|nr:T9SS type A sorting domain-containing protein [Pontibacter kalidii]
MSGAADSDTVTVTGPEYSTGSAGPDKKLTCKNSTVTLEGSGSQPVVWLASDGGNIVSGARTLTPVVDAPGTYTMVLTEITSGCKFEDVVVVTRDESKPAVTAIGGKLDCTTSSVQLTGASSADDATYNWTGPNDYTSTEQNPTVTVAGDYILTVTDPQSGCSASTMVAVTPSSSELIAKEYLIDFNREQSGLISSIETNAGPVSITGRKRKPGGTETYAPENHAAIFNSQAPTGDDADLYTTDWGRVLIINTDQSDVPDDNQWGGELILDFSAIGAVTLESMGLLDLDHYEDMSWVYMYDKTGNELHKIHLKTMGNNSKQTVDLGNTRGVTKLKVVLDGRDGSGYFAGSGAIDDIKFRVEKEVASPCEHAPQQEALQALAYPTTFSDRATVQFTLQDAGVYAVNLYDTQGNLVRELQKGTAVANEQIIIEVAAGSLKEGMYLARIVSPVGNKTLKLILER